MKLWMIEGLPGAGKSTIAGHLATLTQEAGFEAVWYREESIDHPVHPRTLTSQRHKGDTYIPACLQSWTRFIDEHREDSVVHILEGSAFQSTVRFMMEQNMAEIAGYYRRFENIVASVGARLLYLRPSDPLKHSRSVAAWRGNDWAETVAAYLEKTPYSMLQGIGGQHGMHRFWSDYAVLCEQLLEETSLPTEIVDIVPGDWKRNLPAAINFFGMTNSGIAPTTQFSR